MSLRVLSAILFYPRGGSAHAARALAQGLRALGCSVTLVAGSRSELGVHGDARAFYGDVHVVEFDPALASEDPMRYEGPPGTAPMHPSFEDRPGAPDRVFAALDDLDYERQVRVWARELQRARAAEADVLHIHHLTPLHEAAARVAPHVPVVGHLHGTELLMLERIASGPPSEWAHAERWAARMRTWAARSARLIVAPSGIERAGAVLDVPPERLVPLPSGVDVELFAPRSLDRDGFWQEVLVRRPQGWLAGHPPGSARYSQVDVAKHTAGAVLVYVGRFTAVKRLDRLIGAFGVAQRRASSAPGLVLVGGHPGEWEGEHPADTASRLGVSGVFLAGWHAHEDLPDFFSAADAVVSASEREQFGQVLVEGMACGLPALAPRSLGPAGIIDDGRTGWLVNPDDEAALAAALSEVVEDQHERIERGRAARLAVCERFTWSGISAKLFAVLAEVVDDARPASAIEA